MACWRRSAGVEARQGRKFGGRSTICSSSSERSRTRTGSSGSGVALGPQGIRLDRRGHHREPPAAGDKPTGRLCDRRRPLRFGQARRRGSRRGRAGGGDAACLLGRGQPRAGRHREPLEESEAGRMVRGAKVEATCPGRSAARRALRGVVRCRTGTVAVCCDPGSAAHRVACRRAAQSADPMARASRCTASGTRRHEFCTFYDECAHGQISTRFPCPATRVLAGSDGGSPHPSHLPTHGLWIWPCSFK